MAPPSEIEESSLLPATNVVAVEVPAGRAAGASTPNIGGADQDVESPLVVNEGRHYGYGRTVCTFLNNNFYGICIGVVVATIFSRFVVVAGNAPRFCITPEGSTIQHTLDVEHFHKVKTSIAGDVHITHAEHQKVTIETSPNILDQVASTVHNGEYDVGLKGSCYHNVKLTVYIEVPSLDSITATGSGDIYVDFSSSSTSTLDRITVTGSGDIHADFGRSPARHNKTIVLSGSGDSAFTMRNVDVLMTQLTGSGKLTLTGDAQTHNAALLGSGGIQAFEFPTQTVSLNLVGSGDSHVTVNESLKGKMIGSGDVLYKGDPKVEVSGFGSGKVKKVGR